MPSRRATTPASRAKSGPSRPFGRSRSWHEQSSFASLLPNESALTRSRYFRRRAILSEQPRLSAALHRLYGRGVPPASSTNLSAGQARNPEVPRSSSSNRFPTSLRVLSAMTTLFVEGRVRLQIADQAPSGSRESDSGEPLRLCHSRGRSPRTFRGPGSAARPHVHRGGAPTFSGEADHLLGVGSSPGQFGVGLAEDRKTGAGA